MPQHSTSNVPYEPLSGSNPPPRLTDHNYPAWAIWVKSSLIARGHWDMVDPTGEEAARRRDPAYRAWEMADRRAWLDIVSLCDFEDAVKPHRWETAKELWGRLERTKTPLVLGGRQRREARGRR